ncbi:hypothetical protein [Priestia megaterium]|uniref:hypothetical protein n=1 Tax=Priestia megaterium TaxID=1404 RepID=UPI002E1CD5E7|nr:hypothetical protein [Priestia megaterium]
MYQLANKEQFPRLKIDVDVPLFIDEVFDLYEEIVTDSIVFNNLHDVAIPAFTHYMALDDFTFLVDDLASYELFGVSAEFAPLNDDAVEDFWQEYDRQALLMNEDLFNIMKFYKMSYCLNEEKNIYINLPIKEVW